MRAFSTDAATFAASLTSRRTKSGFCVKEDEEEEEDDASVVTSELLELP